MRMINYEPKDGDFVSGEVFVALARAVLATRNTGNFHDDWVQIRTDYNGHDIEITRCKQIVDDGHRKSHLGVSNPTTMVVNGEIIRHHGEHCYVTQHLRDLLNPPPRNADEVSDVIQRWLDETPATEWGAFEKALNTAIGGE